MLEKPDQIKLYEYTYTIDSKHRNDTIQQLMLSMQKDFLEGYDIISMDWSDDFTIKHTGTELHPGSRFRYYFEVWGNYTNEFIGEALADDLDGSVIDDEIL